MREKEGGEKRNYAPHLPSFRRLPDDWRDKWDPLVHAPRADDEFEMFVIDVNRTSKTTKGGRKLGFTITVVVGNGNGLIGWGKGKSGSVGEAIDKAFLDS